MNKSIQLVTLPSGVCVLHIESEYDIEMIGRIPMYTRLR